MSWTDFGAAAAAVPARAGIPPSASTPAISGTDQALYERELDIGDPPGYCNVVTATDTTGRPMVATVVPFFSAATPTARSPRVPSPPPGWGSRARSRPAWSP